jgi:hypothetical protein
LRKYGGCGAVQPGRRVGGGGGVEPPVGGGTPSGDLRPGSCLPSLSDSAASYTLVPDLLFILPAEKGCAVDMEVEGLLRMRLTHGNMTGKDHGTTCGTGTKNKETVRPYPNGGSIG